MLKLEQRHKIAISVAAIFMVSLSVMLFLLGDVGKNVGHVQANVGHSGGEGKWEEVISEEVEAKKLLEEYKAYFKDSGDLIFSTDVEGKFKYLSENFCDLIDQNCNESEDELFFDYMHSSDLSSMASKHAKIVQDGKDLSGVGPYRFRVGNSDSYVLVMFNIHIVLDDENEVIEIVFFVNDITKKVNEMHNINTEPVRTDVKSSESSESDEESEDDDGLRPGDNRLMVEKIS
jgi:PAS domain S-box-containing protein